MNLLKGNINQEYIIEKINIDKSTRLRLQVLGVLKGTKVKILNKRNNGAEILRVRGTRLGIDKVITEAIECTCLKNTKEEKDGKTEYCIYRKS